VDQEVNRLVDVYLNGRICEGLFCSPSNVAPSLLFRSIMYTAGSGKFSSDRTIREYAEDIW